MHAPRRHITAKAIETNTSGPRTRGSHVARCRYGLEKHNKRASRSLKVCVEFQATPVKTRVARCEATETRSTHPVVQHSYLEISFFCDGGGKSINVLETDVVPPTEHVRHEQTT